MQRGTHNKLKFGVGVLGLALVAMLVMAVASPSSALAATRSVVKHVSPASGPVAGGTTVTLTGIRFTGVREVWFGGSRATGVEVVSATKITCKAPAHAAGTTYVRVVTSSGLSSANLSYDHYTYIAPIPPSPVVTAVSPTSGSTAGGTGVTITGTNFTGATAVMFGLNGALFMTSSATSITATSPAGAGILDVRVITPAGTSATSSADLFTYAPNITSLSPNHGSIAGGTSVTITGTDFTGYTAVKFGTTTATVTGAVDGTSLTVTSPVGAVGSLGVTVITPAGTSTASTYTYESP